MAPRNCTSELHFKRGGIEIYFGTNNCKLTARSATPSPPFPPLAKAEEGREKNSRGVSPPRESPEHLFWAERGPGDWQGAPGVDDFGGGSYLPLGLPCDVVGALGVGSFSFFPLLFFLGSAVTLPSCLGLLRRRRRSRARRRACDEGCGSIVGVFFGGKSLARNRAPTISPERTAILTG